MFSLDDAFLAPSLYILQKDFYWRAIVYSFGVILWVELFRSQIAEINVLQLIPGLYLFLLFFSLIFLVVFSTLFLQISFEVDNRKSCGTKTLNRMEIINVARFSLSIVSTQVLVSLNTIVPIAFDSFNSYGERTLENIWSLDEILLLELFLLVVIVIASQFPVILLLDQSNEEDILSLPSYWKQIGILVFVLAGIITPTIDGFTQLSFSISAFSLYILVIIVVTKRVNVKYAATYTSGS